MSIGKSPTQYLGVLPQNPPNVIRANRAPNSGDRAYNIGDLWVDVTNEASYQNDGGGSWIALGTGTTGAVVSLTGDSGGAIVPVAGNIDILGTASEIDVVGTAGTLTVSLPAALVAPGSIVATTTIESTTTMTAGTGFTATLGNIVASTGDVIATLGDITASAGNIAATLGSVAAGTSVTAGTSITATAGDITATLGHVIIDGAAKQLRIHGGAATDFIGTATLVAGEATVLNTNIAATDRIFVERSAVNASTALGVFKVVKNAGVSFVITACDPADASTQTGDASTVEYVIIRQV